MKRIDLVRLIGRIIGEVDVLLSKLGVGQPEWLALDDLRDDLARYQNKIIKSDIDDRNSQYIAHAESLKSQNMKLLEVIEDLERVAEVIDTVVAVVGVVEKIVSLLPTSVLLRSRLASPVL